MLANICIVTASDIHSLRTQSRNNFAGNHVLHCQEVKRKTALDLIHAFTFP